MDLEGRWKAILIGGLITGLGPFVPVLNLACCLFPLVGGLVAVSIYRGSHPSAALTNNDGVVLGALSGLAGAILFGVLLIPLAYFASSLIGGFLGGIVPSVTEMPPGARSMVQGFLSNVGNVVAIVVLLKIIGHLALSLAFGIAGGIIAVALYARKSIPTN